MRLDGYNMIKEHRIGDKHQKADNLRKKRDFYETKEQSEADRPEEKMDFHFWTRKLLTAFHSQDGSINQGNHSRISLS